MIETTFRSLIMPRIRPIINNSFDVVVGYSPVVLFDNGEQGVWYDPSDITVLFQDSGGTTSVTSDGDPVGLIQDKSGNDNHAIQQTSAYRLTYRDLDNKQWLDPDGVDDNMDVPLIDGTYSVIQGTLDGVLDYKINVTGGTGWKFYGNTRNTPNDSITGLIVVSAVEDKTDAKQYLTEKGNGANFTGVTSIAGWFGQRDDITEINLVDWDTSSVTDCSSFIANCDNLTTLDVSNWNTSNVTDASIFAFDCSNLTTLDVSNWDTGNVTNFATFIYNCPNLTTLDVSNWNTSSVTIFDRFAAYCSNLTTLDVSNWDVSSVNNFGSFVIRCSNLTTLDVSLWDVSSVTNFTGFIRESSVSTLDVSNWNTINVKNFPYFAYQCSNLTTLDVSNWNTSSVTNFTTFMGRSGISTLDVSLWDVSNVTNFSGFADNCPNLTVLDVSNWNTINVTNFSYFAFGCSNLTTLDVSNWITSSVTKFASFVNQCVSLTTVTVNGGAGNPFADSPCIDYTGAFNGTNLDQQSIDDILVAIEQANTTDGTFDQSGGSAPSVTGQAAIDSLRARNWTITVTGGY